MLKHLPLIAAMALATVANAWAAAAAEPDTAKQVQTPHSAKTGASAAAIPAAKALAKKPPPQRSVPTANPVAMPIPGKMPALGLCDGD